MNPGTTITGLQSLVDKFFQQLEEIIPQPEPTMDDGAVEDSCGTEAAVGKVGLVSGVLPANRSESQQNCAGLGAGWGIQPAGMESIYEPDWRDAEEVSHNTVERERVVAIDHPRYHK